MGNPLRDWRRSRREIGIWQKARDRSASLREAEIVGEVDLALMNAGHALTKYRQLAHDREAQLDQLRECRLHLEASLGMLENVMPD